MNLVKKSLVLLIIIFTSGCGYKVVDNSKLNKINLKEIRSYGDKRINFAIKNNIMFGSSSDNEQNLIIELNTKKTKNVKEKNINNEIIKYEMALNTTVKLDFLEINIQKEFNVVSIGSFAVSDRYSTTLRNEKRILEDLTNDISNKIQREINFIINDL